MPKPIEEIDPKFADQIWRIAGSLEWTAEDWATFYFAITRAFVEIVGRRARSEIEKRKKTERIVVDEEKDR